MLSDYKTRTIRSWCGGVLVCCVAPKVWASAHWSEPVLLCRRDWTTVERERTVYMVGSRGVVLVVSVTLAACKL